MIHSMTAFGRVQRQESGYAVIVEIRTLNGRGLDIVLRLPKNYIEFEDTFRKQIAQSIRRGRVEAFMQVEPVLIQQKKPQLNLTLARYYWEQLQTIHRHLPGTDTPTLGHLLSIPFIFESNGPIEDRDLLKALLTDAVEEALQQVSQMRAQEGDALAQDCLARLNALRETLSAVEGRKDLVVEEYRARLHERLQELLQGSEIDENRFMQEVAYLAERSDVNEEIVRLKSHFDQFETLITGPAPPADGRRLDFLTQELHREVNTIGSKTGDLEITRNVVRMKSEIAKLKEQVQNME